MIAAAAFILFFAACGVGAILSVVLSGRASAVITGWTGSICSILLTITGASVLISGADVAMPVWTIHGVGDLSLRIDALSAIFLCAIGVVYVSCCLFTPGWLAGAATRVRLANRYGVLHFALMVSVAAILTAGDTLMFLISWESMSILTYILLNVRSETNPDPNAGYIMLAMSEAGFLAVLIAFLIPGNANTSFAALHASAMHLSGSAAWAFFLLSFFGFGVKCGLVPVNFWLPRAYTAAPSVFVPVLAGVTLNLGFYGILRLNADISPPHGIGPGVVALIVGSITAIVGILYATTENDLKTMLAYSSIENAGIIVAGIGASLVFRSSGNSIPAALALTAALYHTVNHSIYKTLLFESTGLIESTTGNRDMDPLGGLVRAFPALSVVFLIGCLSIAAVPPFNGFVSEWMTLQTFLRSALIPSAIVKVIFALCGALLALTAALAVTCFVKTYAMTFLGIRRRDWKNSDVVPAPRERASMILLAVACLLMGILPTWVIPVLDRAVQPIAGASATASLVPPFFTATRANQQLPPAFLDDFHNLGAQTGAGVLPARGLVVLLRGAEQNPVVFAMSPAYSLITLALILLVVWFIVTRSTRKRRLTRNELWAGGIPVLLPEMSYTATAFSNPVRVVFQAVFRPNVTEDTRETVAVHFRTAIRRRREETNIVDRLFFHPLGFGIGWVAALLARMHHGRLNAYVAYALGFLMCILFLYRLA